MAATAETDPAASEDDLKTFGYARGDLGSLAAQVASLAAAIETLHFSASGHDPEGMAADAAAVLKSANALQTQASRAEGRLGGLGPLDPRLRSARIAAIDAFSATAAYAKRVIAAANGAMTLDVEELRDVAAEAARLQGTADDLAKSYDDLRKELERWAEANPKAAAAAAARYGP